MTASVTFDTTVTAVGNNSSLRRHHVDNINAAKTAETRQRRIDKTVTLFREGKQR